MFYEEKLSFMSGLNTCVAFERLKRRVKTNVRVYSGWIGPFENVVILDATLLPRYYFKGGPRIQEKVKPI